MKKNTIFSKPHPWFTAEGVEDEKPVMYRGRQIPRNFIGTPLLPAIFVISLHFDTSDVTGLPTRSQYETMGAFEKLCIDAIEMDRVGITAFIKTFNGMVRYFLYVSSVDAASNLVAMTNNVRIPMEFAGGEDPAWDEYKAFLKGVRL